MKRHAAEFAELPAEQLLHYEMRAHAMRARRAQEAEDEQALALAASKIQAMRTQVAEVGSVIASRLSNAVLDDPQVAKLFHYAAELAEVVPPLSSPDFHAEDPLNDALKQELQQFAAHDFRPEFPLAATFWVAVVCRHREMFRSSIIALPNYAEDKLNFYIILFAMQKPYVLVLAPLTLEEVDVDTAVQAGQDWFDAVAVRRFFWDGSSVVDASTLAAHDVCDVWVHPSAVAMGDWRFECDKSSFPLAKFVGDKACVKVAKKARKDETNTKVKLAADDIAQYPWLAKYTHTSSTTASRARPPRSSHRHVDEEEEPLSPDAVDRAFAQLHSKRAEWSCEQDVGSDHFKTMVRGGAWTQAHRNVAVDSVAAQACTQMAKNFCIKYDLPKLASYSFAKFGERVAKVLAEGWVDKMTYLHSMYLEAEDDGFVFDQDVMQGYEEPTDLVNLRAELGDLHKGVRDRLEQLKMLKPKQTSTAASSSA